MNLARYVIGMCIISLGLVTCRGSSAPDVAPELGIIDFYSDRSEVLTVPATARAGEDFEVVVRTFGNGCVSAAGTGVRYRGATAVLTPYDNDMSRSPRVICLDILNRPVHTVTLRFPNAGVATVRVNGRSEPAGQAATVEATIVVSDAR